MIASAGYNDVIRIYNITQRDGIDYNLAFIGRDFNEVLPSAVRLRLHARALRLRLPAGAPRLRLGEEAADRLIGIPPTSLIKSAHISRRHPVTDDGGRADDLSYLPGGEVGSQGMSDSGGPTPLPTAGVHRRRRIPLIWIVPLLTGLIAAWLAWDTFSKRGPDHHHLLRDGAPA